MADYISLKRKHNISLPWEHDKYKQDKVTLPRPIIGLNFPKSATTTMSKYFQCAGIISAHTSTLDGRIGICMMENHLADKPPMDGCSTRQNYTDPTEVKVEVVFDIPEKFLTSNIVAGNRRKHTRLRRNALTSNDIAGNGY